MEVVDGYPLVLTTGDEPRLGREDGHAQDARRVVGRELDSLDRLRRLAPRPQVDAVGGQSSVYIPLSLDGMKPHLLSCPAVTNLNRFAGTTAREVTPPLA